MSKKKVAALFMAIVMCTSLFTGLLAETGTAYAEDGLVLHLKFDGDSTDASGLSNDAESTYGKITYEDGVFGKSAVFDGKSYLEIPDNDSLDLKNLTISLWAYKSEDRKMDKRFPYLYKGEDEDSWAPPYKLAEYSDNQPTIDLHDTSDDTELGQYYLTGNSVDYRKWFLLTVTFNGSEVRIYENDVLVKKDSVSGAPATTIGDLYIGMTEGEYFFQGNMDDLRIYNRALAAQEVTTLYEKGLAESPKLFKQTDSLVAHYKFNGDFKDSSEFGNDAEVTAGKISFVDGLNGKAAKFGKGSYLEVPDNESIDFDEGFSLTGWLNVYSDNSDYMTLINKPGVSTTYDSNEIAYQIHVNYNLYDFNFTPFGYQTGVDYSRLTFDNSLKNKWVHIAVTYDSDEIRWYYNGKMIQKSEVSDDYGYRLAHSKGNLMIGSDGEYFLNGAVDELKLYNYDLTAKEVAADAKNKDSISISSANQKSISALKANNTVTLVTSRKYIETGESSKLNSGVTYKTSNKKVFTISSKGVLKAVKKGSAKLTITHGAISKTYTVTVK
jgi:hypothetical protein